MGPADFGQNEGFKTAFLNFQRTKRGENNMFEAEKLVHELTQGGVKKAWIAEECGVAWQTVHSWSKGEFGANPKHTQTLRKLLYLLKNRPADILWRGKMARWKRRRR